MTLSPADIDNGPNINQRIGRVSQCFRLYQTVSIDSVLVFIWIKPWRPTSVISGGVHRLSSSWSWCLRLHKSIFWYLQWIRWPDLICNVNGAALCDEHADNSPTLLPSSALWSLFNVFQHILRLNEAQLYFLGAKWHHSHSHLIHLHVISSWFVIHVFNIVWPSLHSHTHHESHATSAVFPSHLPTWLYPFHFLKLLQNKSPPLFSN